jgi:hypothetical protein
VVEEEHAMVYHVFANPRLEHMEGGDEDDEEEGGGEDAADEKEEGEGEGAKEEQSKAGSKAGGSGNGKGAGSGCGNSSCGGCALDDDEEEEDDPGALSFGLECGPALEALIHVEEAAESGVKVRDLPLPKKERLELVRRLVAAGVLAVVG